MTVRSCTAFRPSRPSRSIRTTPDACGSRAFRGALGSAAFAGTIALGLVLLVAVLTLAPAAAQENALTYQTEEPGGEEEVSIVSSAALTAAPMVLSPAADLQRALQTLIEYPDMAWDMKVDGTGYVEIRIDTSGRVTDATVIEGWGFGLDEEVLEAVRELHFSPARAGSRPVEVVAQFPLTLTLD